MPQRVSIRRVEGKVRIGILKLFAIIFWDLLNENNGKLKQLLVVLEIDENCYV